MNHTRLIIMNADLADYANIKYFKLFSFFGGRQPLCGNGVTSLIISTSIPLLAKERIALSRPEPGPFTNTSTLFKPASKAVFAASAAAIWAA